MKECDGRSVGIVARREGRTLLILRGRYPRMWAAPAGHQDDDPVPALAAVRELFEETGLEVTNLQHTYRGTHQNPCRRGGERHTWDVYGAEVTGDVHQTEEAPTHRWLDDEELEELVQSSREHPADLESSDPQQQLEPVWVELFTAIREQSERS